jgi:hypothetical protein
MKAIINMGMGHYLELYEEEDIRRLINALAAPAFAPTYMLFADSENGMSAVNLNSITRVDFIDYTNERLCKSNCCMGMDATSGII